MNRKLCGAHLTFILYKQLGSSFISRSVGSLRQVKVFRAVPWGETLCFSVDGLWEFSIRSQQLSADKSQGQVKSIRVFISFTIFLKNAFYSLCFQGSHRNKSCFTYPPLHQNVISSCHHVPPGPGSSGKLKILQILGQTTRADATAWKHIAQTPQTWSAPLELRLDEEKCIYSILKVQEFNPEGRMVQGQVLVLLVLKHGLSSTFHPLNNWWMAESTDWPCLQSPPGKSPRGGDTSGCDPAAASAVLAFFLMAKRKHVSLREHLLGKQSSVDGERIHLSFHIYFGGTIVSFSMSK